MKISALVQQLQACMTERPEVGDIDILSEGYEGWSDDSTLLLQVAEEGCQVTEHPENSGSNSTPPGDQPSYEICLHVTSPEMKGSLVTVVQQRLIDLGFSRGPVDSIYGPLTERAVEAFQAARNLVVDGVVGSATYKALLDNTMPVLVPPSDTLSVSGGKALVLARQFLGVTESPPQSNKTQFGVWYGVNGVPWCAIFVSYCFNLGAGLVLCDGYKGSGKQPGKGCAYVPTIEDWLRATGRWVGRVDPLPGDIVIYNWDGKGPEHIGIVESSFGNGAFGAIEGNTSVDSDSNGGAVMRRTRNISQVDGFGRLT
jgi:hypothetical protein